MDDFSETETLKLRSVQRAVSMGDVSTKSATINSSKANDVSTTSREPTARFIRSTILSVFFGLWGWYYPKYVVAQRADAILAKTPPYQSTAAGDVLLDFTLNAPLTDPMIISCEYNMID